MSPDPADRLLPRLLRLDPELLHPARIRRAARRLRLGRWLLVLALAGAAASAVDRTATAAEAERRAWGETRTVLVARLDVPAGDPVPADAVALEERPLAVLPADPLDALPVGAVARDPLVAGEVVSARRIDPTGSSPLAASLPAGTRGVAVPLGDAVPPLVPGDRVDVLVAGPGLDPAGATTAARAAVVAQVGELAVVVAVDAADAPLVSAAAAGGLAGLVLVPGTG